MALSSHFAKGAGFGDVGGREPHCKSVQFAFAEKNFSSITNKWPPTLTLTLPPNELANERSQI